MTIRNGVMEPLVVLNQSMPGMKIIPETCPARSRNTWDVASGAGRQISVLN